MTCSRDVPAVASHQAGTPVLPERARSGGSAARETLVRRQSVGIDIDDDHALIASASHLVGRG